MSGATSYEVALYKENIRVFRAVTRTPSVTIPVGVHSADVRQSVSPGAYEWYVWPMRGGKRAAVAVVSAKLVLNVG